MKFLSGITRDGQSEMIAIDKIISIADRGNDIKILTGAGLYWFFDRSTVSIMDLSDNKLMEVLRNEQL